MKPSLGWEEWQRGRGTRNHLVTSSPEEGWSSPSPLLIFFLPPPRRFFPYTDCFSLSNTTTKVFNTRQQQQLQLQQRFNSFLWFQIRNLCLVDCVWEGVLKELSR
ncbi:hypothetical protein QVD17_02229 [Tagetes erecta]|uniref:Uncharacterized protein n=1 Tax=Tagetes erecta TaxID=13708 RepID=A0AAD8L904_TARER|nr:hypothetical protein QVD17_02229 [Tagetes erecta]